MEDEARALKSNLGFESPVIGLGEVALASMRALVRLTLKDDDKLSPGCLVRLFEYEKTILPGLSANARFRKAQRASSKRNSGGPRTPFGKWCARLANAIQWWWIVDNRLASTQVQQCEEEWIQILRTVGFPNGFVFKSGASFRPRRDWVLSVDSLALRIGDTVAEALRWEPGFLSRIGIADSQYITQDGNRRIAALRRAIHRAVKWQMTVNEPLALRVKSQ
ncbi:MAG: hypothetical protein ACKV19_04620 [Verrucomicrobiales bacterium]